MRFYKQLVKHDPDNGRYGDCFRTCLACLLNVPPEDVPHFLAEGNDAFWPAVTEWLSHHKLSLFHVPFSGDDLQGLFRSMQHLNPDLLYLLAGKSPRGVNHQVIAQGDRILHDPSTEGGGLVGPCVEDGMYWVGLLVPSFIHQGDHHG